MITLYGFLVVVGFMLIIHPLQIFGPLAGMWFVGGFFLSLILAMFARIPVLVTLTATFIICFIQSFFYEPLGNQTPLDDYMYFSHDPRKGGAMGTDTIDDVWRHNPHHASWLWIKTNQDDSKVQEWLVRNNKTFEDLLAIGESNTMDWHNSMFHSDEYHKDDPRSIFHKSGEF